MIFPPIASLIERFRSFALAFPLYAQPDEGSPCDLFLYEILIQQRSIQDRKLTRLGGKERPDKEAIMLDVAFVALGVAVLTLMGVYALALRRL
jgi:hypothetical protein